MLTSRDVALLSTPHSHGSTSFPRCLAKVGKKCAKFYCKRESFLISRPCVCEYYTAQGARVPAINACRRGCYKMQLLTADSPFSISKHSTTGTVESEIREKKNEMKINKNFIDFLPEGWIPNFRKKKKKVNHRKLVLRAIARDRVTRHGDAMSRCERQSKSKGRGCETGKEKRTEGKRARRRLYREDKRYWWSRASLEWPGWITHTQEKEEKGKNRYRGSNDESNSPINQPK